MSTISEVRTEKNLEDARADFNAKKKSERNQRRIKQLQQNIEREKESIILCLELDFIQMAKSKLSMIEKIQDKIVELSIN